MNIPDILVFQTKMSIMQDTYYDYCYAYMMGNPHYNAMAILKLKMVKAAVGKAALYLYLVVWLYNTPGTIPN